MRRKSDIARTLIKLLPLFSLVVVGDRLSAQDASAEPRLRKMEAEIRALQRNVFPGGGGEIFMPEIRSRSAQAVTPGRPATSPTTDMLLRLTSIESALTRLTARIEQTSERVRRLEARLPASGGSAGASADTSATQAASLAASHQNPGNPQGRNPAKVPLANVLPSAQRLATVRAIIKPQTNDRGDDEYSYGFRLWQAHLYPEAQQQLKMFIGKFGHHARISFARNLLGRAFLDDGKPVEAAKWFLTNYQGGKADPRAPDSLLYLAEAMLRLKDKKRACIALKEFGEVYSSGEFTRLRSLYDDVHSRVACQ